MAKRMAMCLSSRLRALCDFKSLKPFETLLSKGAGYHTNA
jgi:hypothetical protein